MALQYLVSESGYTPLLVQSQEGTDKLTEIAVMSFTTELFNEDINLLTTVDSVPILIYRLL